MKSMKEKKYIENYVNDTDKSASETTNTLGKILNDCFENEVYAAFSQKTRFVTYENRRNPHISIHNEGCAQIAKRGGAGEGEYNEFETLEDAENYAKATNLEIRYCYFCMKDK